MHKGSPLVYLSDGEYIGSAVDLMKWALENFRYVDTQSDIIYNRMAKKRLKEMTVSRKDVAYAFMEVDVDGASTKVVFELFTKTCPLTSQRFLELCEGTFKVGSKKSGYKGSRFDRVSKGFAEGG